MLSATGDLAEWSVAPPLDLRKWVRYRQGTFLHGLGAGLSLPRRLALLSDWIFLGINFENCWLLFQPKLFSEVRQTQSPLPAFSHNCPFHSPAEQWHFTAFKVIATEAVLLKWSLLSFVTGLFAPVSNSNVFKNIETNYGFAIETKVQGEKILSNNERVGGGGQKRKTKLITWSSISPGKLWE